MKHLKICITFICIMLIGGNISAQLATGQWNSHMSYVEGQKLAISDNKVYTVASGSLFSYGLNDNAIETYSKVNGLNDVYINDIAYCSELEQLVICYDNGNIDLMSSSEIINISDIKRKVIYGTKEIYKVDIIDKTAYLSTSFGIIKINIEKAEISETYVLSNGENNPIHGVVVVDNNIYAATDQGLYVAEADNNNLQNFASWSKESTLTSNTLPVIDIVPFNDNIVICREEDSENKIHKRVGTTWTLFARASNFGTISSTDNWLTITDLTKIYYYDQDFNYNLLSAYKFGTTSYSSQNTIYSNKCIIDENDNFWIADSKQGLVKYTTEATQTFTPQGPATNTIWDIDISQNILRTVHGGLSDDYNNTWIDGAISTYQDNEWKYLGKINGGQSYEDYVGILIDPIDASHYYVSSFGRGILEYIDDDLVTAYTDKNSTIENAIPGSTKYIRTIGMAFDNDQNLWVNNSSSLQQLHVKTIDDNWYGFKSDLPDNYGRYGNIVITSENRKWMTTPRYGDGILVYNDNGTFDDSSDDESRYFSIMASGSSSTEQVSDQVHCLEISDDGSIWVGCDNGVVQYSNPDNIFDSNTTPLAYRINRAKDDGSGQGEYLLSEESVQTIAIDGGNRKWLGTQTTGVMLVSDDGQDIIYHFTSDNSPLPSDNIKKIKINDETGEVFIATTEGMVSYQADATSGEENFDDLKVYPNPVREDFTGEVTITGLVEETIVKITDVSGNLVNQTTSNGGTATWDGTNFYGNRVGSGVYLIFCSDNTGEKSGMTKVLFIN